MAVPVVTVVCLVMVHDTLVSAIRLARPRWRLLDGIAPLTLVGKIFCGEIRRMFVETEL